jgi:hypothetical protein
MFWDIDSNLDCIWVRRFCTNAVISAGFCDEGSESILVEVGIGSPERSRGSPEEEEEEEGARRRRFPG